MIKQINNLNETHQEKDALYSFITDLMKANINKSVTRAYQKK